MPHKDPEARREWQRKRYHEKHAERRAYQKEYYQKNREKMREYGNTYYKENRDKMYQNSLMRKYGVTLDDYDRMLEEQNGVCKICEGTCHHTQRRETGTLSVDHCHETGLVRGLLCSHCNSLLGWARDNTDTLRKAIDYLENSTA